MTLKDYMETKKKRIGNLPDDYGEQMAKESIEKAFNDEFIKSIMQREKQQSIQIENTDELFNTITIEEATDDYYRAYKDYRRDEEVYEVQLGTILKLPETAEITIMQNSGIAVHGLKEITNVMLKEIENITDKYYINLTSKDEITLIAYFKEDYVITEGE